MFMPWNLQGKNTFPNVQIVNNMLERVTVTKFQGIIIDQNGTWENYMTFIISKIAKNIWVDRRIICSQEKKRLCITQSFIHASHTAPSFRLAPLKVASPVFFLCKNISSEQSPSPTDLSVPLLYSSLLALFTLNLFQIRVFFVSQSINNRLSVCFLNVLQFNSQIHHYSTRSADNLHPAFFSIFH